ncbi:MAG TPA: selenocysteine-specific translation elongation factor [Chthonomonadaceae bacterium]|nr:selenocysteine-specific translation elongation factor [Chthonomonadaceae bacterium]
MKHVIIGAAGHVDHGKTSLIEALTGTNTDRLKEEQERGMTIDLGFAALKLPDGTVAGVVDVPGHERFLKNMLAGATGVDVALMVIASDEGVMPQTVEHLDVLRLLDVKNGIVALTKIDLVDREWSDVVEADIRARLSGTFLERSPIVRVSAVTGKGIDALKRYLLSAVSRAEARSAAAPFRMPIDRVFTRPGFGTVVTGTLAAGTLRTGDTAEIQPEGLSVRVRGLHVHNSRVKEAEAGSRVAANLAGIDPDQIRRGSVLGAPGLLSSIDRFDATVRLLPAAPPLKDRARVRVHIGAAEVIGRLRLLGGASELAPGGAAYAQFQGEHAFAALPGDRFIVRAYSPLRTLGGGIVLETAPERHKRADPAVLARLEARERGTPLDVVEGRLREHPTGLLLREIVARTGLAEQDVAAALDELSEREASVALGGGRHIASAQLRAITERAVSTLSAYHERFPLRPGMPREELRAALGRAVEPKPLAALFAQWQAKGTVLSEGATARLPTFEVALNERQAALLNRIEEVYTARGIAIPSLGEVVQAVHAPNDAVSALLRVGVERGRFHHISDDQYLAEATLVGFKRTVAAYITKHGAITVSAFRDLTASNRKLSMLVLEFLDSIRFTRRVGDDRVLYG